MASPHNELIGFGLGLRPQHFPDLLNHPDGRYPGIDWFEIISENFINVGGMPFRNLMGIRELYPVAMHGVSLSIGGPDPIDEEYLKGLKDLIIQINPSVVSDHLCWTGAHGINLHDLLPLPLTRDALNHVSSRISHVQDTIQRRLAIENPSTYVSFRNDEMTEWEFLSELTSKTGCDLLLDVNNVYVSAFNHGFDAHEYLREIPEERVCQIHLAGHENNGDHIIDTHDSEIVDPVWDLYRHTVKQMGYIPTMIERDDNIPPIAELVEELQIARQIVDDINKGAAA